jgi:nucleotide-binding universal stress UspA family protein
MLIHLGVERADPNQPMPISRKARVGLLVASEQVPAEKGNAAEQIERIASEVGAGLVVAGAYGHSRLREWVFGGVTRRLLNPSDRCSLLSR